MIRVGSIVLRVDDLQRQTEFWEAALDYVRREGDSDDFVLLRPRDGIGPNLSLDRARSTLQKDRVAGDSIPYVYVGRLVRYRLSDVEAYIAALPTCRSTSETAATE